MGKLSISFIIPIYNVELYLEECVDSVLVQINKNESCEIILVNDGSTDHSKEICEKYKRKFSIVKYIEKENGGLSSARNAGLSVATGKYVAFLDADDRVADGCVEKILKWVSTTDADICFMQGMKFYPNGEEVTLGDDICSKEIRGHSKEEVFQYLSTRPKYPGSACTKIFRKDFLVDNELYFPHDRRQSEDLGFCLDCFLKAVKFDALDFPYYEYRQNRKGSITDGVSIRSFSGLLQFVGEFSEKLRVGFGKSDILSQCALSFIAYEYVILLFHYSCLKDDEQSQFFDIINRYKWVLEYGKSAKTKIVNVLLKIVGIMGAAKILRIYMYIRKKRNM